MKEVFTLRRFYLRAGLLSLAFYLMMLVAALLDMFFEAAVDWFIDLMFVGLPSFMAAQSMLLVFAYFRESVTLDDGEVHITHVLGGRTITPPEVLRARWRLERPSLNLYLRDGREVLRFNNFRPDHRRRLINYFREHLSPQVQEGWSEALEHYAANVEMKESAGEYDKVYRALFRGLWKAVFVGPVVGVACGLVLHFYAAHLGLTDLPTWTGSLLLDWVARCTLATALVL